MTNVPFDPVAAVYDRRWFFEDPVAAAILIAEAEEWYQQRTPWRQGSCAKGAGGGADCAGFDQMIFEKTGVIPPLSFPRRSRDYAIYIKKILGYLRGQDPDPQSLVLASIFAELPTDTWPLLTGDILVVKVNADELYHLPIVTEPPRFVQCAAPLGVSKGDAGDPQYKKRIVAIFRARANPLQGAPAQTAPGSPAAGAAAVA